MSAPQAAWQREGTVASFAERRHILIPLLDLQEDVLAKLLTRGGRDVECFLDLGAGAGAVSELVLRTAPGARGVLVDFSEPMLARAQATLAGARNVELVRGDLSRPSWRDGLPAGRYDAIVSGLAIHHLTAERKRALYSEAFELLAPGGIFVNMDFVEVDGPLRGLFDEQMFANAVDAEHQAGRSGEGEDVDFDTGEDRPDTLGEQLTWLRAAGFERVEVHFKWAEAAIFGGERDRS